MFGNIWDNVVKVPQLNELWNKVFQHFNVEFWHIIYLTGGSQSCCVSDWIPPALSDVTTRPAEGQRSTTGLDWRIMGDSQGLLCFLCSTYICCSSDWLHVSGFYSFFRGKFRDSRRSLHHHLSGATFNVQVFFLYIVTVFVWPAVHLISGVLFWSGVFHSF